MKSIFWMKTANSLFHVVLFQPEIPANTGAIGRTCVGIGAKLWLVRPFAFEINDRHLKRAGLDYWPYLDWEAVNDWSHLEQRVHETVDSPRFWFFTKKAEKNYDQIAFLPNDLFVYGTESTGLPQTLLDQHRSNCLKIPMRPQIRSLNLSVSVGITIFEARRQLGF